MAGVEGGLPRLSSEQYRRLVNRIGEPAPTIDRAGLEALVRAWIFNMPFHNLDLLAASLGECRSLTPDQALARCEAGLGGPCHVQALGFASFLVAAGFDVALCSATIGQPGDHLLVRVSLNDGTFLCDVGNGQPYLVPFRIGAVTEVEHLGWRLRAEPVGTRLRLMRWSPELPAGKVVYLASDEPRSWTDFEEIISRHHAQPGFGPFMTGLRAVRIRATRMDTLRDDQWSTYVEDGFQVRTAPVEDIPEILEREFGLGGLPIAEAMLAWKRARSGHAR